MTQHGRLYALDNLRATMMWLGIVLHVAANHITVKSPMPWRDRDTGLAADLLVAFIHAFRMPVFFLLGGFFVAMLVRRRGYDGMLRHRMRRIGLPFVIFWPFLFVATGLLATVYVHLMVHGRPGLDPSLMEVTPDRALINTLHLWFIYYLLWFSALTFLAGHAGRYMSDRLQVALSQFGQLLASSWWGPLLLAVPLALAGASYANGIVAPSGSFIPSVRELMHNGLFFVIGLALFRHQALLGKFATRCWHLAAAGLFFFVLYLALANPQAALSSRIAFFPLLMPFIYGCASWFWSFALIGAFCRYLPDRNRFLSYVSDSSYWMYLVHMLGTIGFGILLYDSGLGLGGKIAANIVATSLACVVTYHVLVRFTPLGTLLNGYRFSYRTGQKIADQNRATDALPAARK